MIGTDQAVYEVVRAIISAEIDILIQMSRTCVEKNVPVSQGRLELHFPRIFYIAMCNWFRSTTETRLTGLLGLPY